MIENNGIKIFKGVENLQVDIIDVNPTKIKYQVKNTPICQFDQHSRARIGIKFIDYKVSDKPEYVVYTKNYLALQNNEELRNKTFETLLELEEIRNAESFKTPFNLMSRNCSYIVEQEMSSLTGQMSRRLKLCEEAFIVGLHWLLREKMIKMGLDFANEFLPGCDTIKSCDYSSADYLSNAFGCLFTGCGRWPSHAQYASFNESCTTYLELESQLNIKIQKSEHDNLQNNKSY